MCHYLSYCEEVDAWREIVALQMLGVEPACRQAGVEWFIRKSGTGIHSIEL